MKNIKFLVLFTAIFSFVIFNGCKKDDTPDPDDNNAKELKTTTITVPDAMAQSSDPGAQTASGYISMANGMAAMTSMLTPPKSTPVFHLKGGNDPEIYQWTVNDDNNNNYNVTLTITETSDLYKWEMKIDGTMDGHEFNNFIFIKAEQYKDGHDNSLTVYDPDKPLTISFVMNWHTENDTYYITFEVPEEIRVEIVVNSDNSGSIDAKEWANEEYDQTYSATWDSSGHGEYWEYDNGEVISHGTW